MSFKIVPISGHFEVHINGKFYCSADTWKEADDEIKEYAVKHKLTV